MNERNTISEQVFWILVALSRGSRHGYAILEDVERLSEGRMRLRTATLYTALRRLVESGEVEPVDPPDDDVDKRRRYYGLTGEGRELLAAETARLEFTLERVRTLVPSPGESG